MIGAVIIIIIIIIVIMWEYLVSRNQNTKPEENEHIFSFRGYFCVFISNGGRCVLVMTLSRWHSKLSQILIKFSVITSSMINFKEWRHCCL